MNDYEVRYSPDDDVLQIVLSSTQLSSPGMEQLLTEGGLEVDVDEKRTKLLALRVNEFSRQVDFSELYEMFGESLVITLAEIQSKLEETRQPIPALPEPMRSRELRSHLVDA
jgi:hypothetical protein